MWVGSEAIPPNTNFWFLVFKTLVDSLNAVRRYYANGIVYTERPNNDISVILPEACKERDMFSFLRIIPLAKKLDRVIKQYSFGFLHSFVMVYP